MTAKNDITGDALKTKQSTDQYRTGWERIFAKKQEPSSTEKSKPQQEKCSKPSSGSSA